MKVETFSLAILTLMQYFAESEGIICESGEADDLSGEDSESSSEPEMDFSHKNKKSRVSASDEIW